MFRRTAAAAILALSTFASAQPASDSPEEISSGMKAIYLHPLATIISTGMDQIPNIIPVTAEIEFEGAKSLILQPTLVFGTGASPEDKNAPSWAPPPPDYEVFEVDLVLGLRKYLNGQKHRGMYLGAALATGYITYERDSSHFYEGGSATGFFVGTLGYLGYRSVWDAITIYTDLGVGYRYMKADVDGSRKAVEISETGPAIDLNLGIGYRF